MTERIDTSKLTPEGQAWLEQANRRVYEAVGEGSLRDDFPSLHKVYPGKPGLCEGLPWDVELINKLASEDKPPYDFAHNTAIEILDWLTTPEGQVLCLNCGLEWVDEDDNMPLCLACAAEDAKWQYADYVHDSRVDRM